MANRTRSETLSPRPRTSYFMRLGVMSHPQALQPTVHETHSGSTRGLCAYLRNLPGPQTQSDRYCCTRRRSIDYTPTFSSALAIRVLGELSMERWCYLLDGYLMISMAKEEGEMEWDGCLAAAASTRKMYCIESVDDGGSNDLCPAAQILTMLACE